jgi:hypothetical protein
MRLLRHKTRSIVDRDKTKAMVPPRLNKAHMTGVNRPVTLTLA